MTDQDTCGAHDRLGADLRATAQLLLDRVRTATAPLRDGAPPAAGSPGECRACPVCAVLAVLRGERSELAARLAEHAAGLVTVLATMLDADGPGARPGSASTGTGRSGPEATGTGRAGPGAAGSGRPGPARPRAERIRVDRPSTGSEPDGAAATGEQTWSGHPRHPHPRVPSTSGRSVQRIAVHRR